MESISEQELVDQELFELSQDELEKVGGGVINNPIFEV